MATKPPMVAPFQPSLQQRIAKARIQKQLQELGPIWDEEALSLEQLQKLAGSKQIGKWCQDVQFVNWLMDRHDFAGKSVAYAEVAVDRLYDIVADPDQDAKNVINAAKELLALADKYPNKRKEMVFLDKDVEKLPEHEVAGQLRMYKKKLGIMADEEEKDLDKEE